MPRIVKRLLVVLVTTVFALIVGEVAVRALELQPLPPPAFTGKGPVMESEDPVLRWEPRPDSNKKCTFRLRDGSERSEMARVNRHGARGKEHALERAPGVFRIVTLGDSFTFGTGVGDEGTWPAGLDRYLAGERAGSATAKLAPVEVWNYGVEGYGTAQEVRLLRERILPRGVDPDLVLLAFFFNDVEDRTVEVAPLTGWRKTLMSFCNENPKGFAKWLRERSMLAETIAYQISRKIQTSNWTRKVTGMFEDGMPGWESVKSALREGRDLAREQGFEFVVALYPPLWREGEHLASHIPYRTFEAFCASESIPCINLDPVLDTLAVDRFWIHPRNHHPDARCHDFVGQAIGRFLVERGLVPRE